MAMANKPGRPRAKNSKASFLKIRIEASEKDAFQQAADVGGVPLSAWVRERLRRAAIRELEEIGERAPFLLDLYPRQ